MDYSIPKVAGSIPTVVRLTFQPVQCGYTYTQNNIKNIIVRIIEEKESRAVVVWYCMGIEEVCKT
jgi:hypothetical protein